MSANNYARLSAPWELRGRFIKNRVVHASITTRFGSGQRVTPKLIAYHENRARGGAAVLITEPVAMLNFQRNVGNKIRVYDADEKAGLTAWAKAVSDAGSHLVAQIQEPGRGFHHKGRRRDALGAAALPDDLSYTVPRRITTEEVEEIIEEFVEGCVLLEECGFSGVEVSAGHGHLFHQFMMARANNRTDKYGVTFEGRCRIVVELLNSIRSRVREDFLIFIKLPYEDGLSNGIDREEALKITNHLLEHCDLDAVTYCRGSHSAYLEHHVPDMHYERMPYIEDTKWFRERLVRPVPVGALSRIIEPLMAEDILEKDYCDFVQIGRSLVTDPGWAIKAFEAREKDIRLCVSCNTCWGLLCNYQPLECDNNPLVGDPNELNWEPSIAEKKLKVSVVGAGVGGLEFAWTAAGKGHEVEVYTKAASYGGKLALMSQLPGSEQVSSVYDYQITQCDKYNVKINYGYGIDEANASDITGDVIVLATGSRCGWPEVFPEEFQEFIQDIRTVSDDYLNKGYGKTPGSAVIYDMDHSSFIYAAAILLADNFDDVYIVTPRMLLAEDENLVVRQGIYGRLSRRKNIHMVLNSNLSDFSLLDEEKVGSVNIYSGETTYIENVSLITYGTPRVPNDELEDVFKKMGKRVIKVGDTFMPRDLLNTVGQGSKLARELEA